MESLTMNKHGHLLLFHSSEWYKNLSREELQQLIAQNNAWVTQLMAQGKAKGGQALDRKGKLVSGKNGRNISDGPFAESKEVIGGYLQLSVESFDEAVAIAQTSPGLAYGGTIEVRPLTDVCPLDTCLEKAIREEQLATA